ncbi:MAG TPA: hypothetical protein VEY91_12750 [Candidatus Limnocylindria bacterium]|nr:hypothetical protein [Candidatus Limnocylindria bacterium]
MMSRQAKCFVLVAVMLTLPVAASAQISRVQGMALQGDYIKDYSSIYSYPAQVPNVGNLIYAELGLASGFGLGGSATDRSMGAVLGNLWDGRLGTWAVHMREFTPQLGQGDLIFAQPAPSYGPYGTDPNTHTNESFDLMWGQKFGTTSFGLRVNRSFYRSESDIGGVATNLEFDVPSAIDPNLGRNILGVGAGVAFEMSPTTNLEGAVLFQNRTFINDDPTLPVDTEEDNPATYVVSARAMWQWQPNVMVVPVFKWYSYDLSIKDNLASTTEDNTLRGWQVGAAGNWTLGSNDLFVLGVTFAQNRVEQEGALFSSPLPGGSTEITEMLTPQLFGALETHVNNWLTLRVGANKGVVHSEKHENTTDTDKVSDSPFLMSLGAGLKVGTLQLDALLNNTFPHTLGYVVSGVPNVVFTKVSATYAF